MLAFISKPASAFISTTAQAHNVISSWADLAQLHYSVPHKGATYNQLVEALNEGPVLL